MTVTLVVCWGAMACGLWHIAQRLPTPTPPRLSDRVIPYLGRPEWRAVAVPQTVPRPKSLTQALSDPAVSLASRLMALSSGDASVQRRLDVLGKGVSVEQFRLEQMLWGIGGSTVGAIILVLRGIGHTHLLPSLLVIALGAAAGVLVRERALTVEVRRRGERLRAELPTMVEMLAMAVGAGAGLLAALDRVSQIGSGVVANELNRVVTDIRVGLPLLPALQHMADRNASQELRRFVDAVSVSVERGTPLADVLAAQAGDAREAERRALIESGGRKEIGMMVPVVFLVLPLSVVFVLFPGFYGLRLGA
jgi:tight adherence protein C